MVRRSTDPSCRGLLVGWRQADISDPNTAAVAADDGAGARARRLTAWAGRRASSRQMRPLRGLNVPRVPPRSGVRPDPAGARTLLRARAASATRDAPPAAAAARASSAICCGVRWCGPSVSTISRCRHQTKSNVRRPTLSLTSGSGKPRLRSQRWKSRSNLERYCGQADGSGEPPHARDAAFAVRKFIEGGEGCEALGDRLGHESWVAEVEQRALHRGHSDAFPLGDLVDSRAIHGEPATFRLPSFDERR